MHNSLFNNVKIKDVKREIGHLVKAIRKREKMSQIELAQQLNVSRMTIQNLEAGKNFTITTFLKVVAHFQLLEELNEVIVQQRMEYEIEDSLY